MGKALVGKSKVDEEVLDELEGVLVSSDVGVDTMIKIIKRIEERVARDKYVSTSELDRILREEIAALLAENNDQPEASSADDFTLPAGHQPHVILVVGVNGVGKTTTIGKLAHQFQQRGKRGAFRSGRHLPRRCGGPAQTVGRARERAGGVAWHEHRPGFSSLRRSEAGSGARGGFSDYRHRRALA